MRDLDQRELELVGGGCFWNPCKKPAIHKIAIKWAKFCKPAPKCDPAPVCEPEPHC